VAVPSDDTMRRCGMSPASVQGTVDVGLRGSGLCILAARRKDVRQAEFQAAPILRLD
jgi:hypothetical protein